MIGHYLLTLTPEQEDRVLTEAMSGRANGAYDSKSRCLVEVAHGFGFANWRFNPPNYMYHPKNRRVRCVSVGITYDLLCYRYGNERINAAIRNRILSNRVRRELYGVGQTRELSPSV